MPTKIRKIILSLLMLITVFIEIKGFGLTFRSLGTGIFIYYTEISNLIALLSAAVALVYLIIKFKSTSCEFPNWLSALRFLSATMLLMTMLITIFVLVPHSPHLKDSLLFSGYGLYHHTLAPIITLFSYLCLEPHFSKKKALLLPLGATFIYGLFMVIFNILGKVDGPYFFLRVTYQPIKTTVIWSIALLLLVLFFATIIYLLSLLVDYLKRKIFK